MDNNKEESTIPYKPTEADLKWLKGEETKDIVPMQMAGLYVPRKIFKRVVVRSIILILMVWPIVPYTVNAVIEPIQKEAMLQQLSPKPEERRAQRILTNLEPFTVIFIAELLTIGIWVILVVPDFLKIYEFNKKYDV